MHRLGTKDHHERYEEEANRLVRRSPKVKPPRHDRRREQIQTESDPDAKDPSDVKDRSMNYKNIGGSVKTSMDDRIPAKSKETGKTVMVSPDTLKEQPGKYEPVDESEVENSDSEKDETSTSEVPADPGGKEAYYGKIGDALREIAKGNPKLESKLKDFVSPHSQISGVIQENPEFPAAPLFPGVKLPAGLRTLKDVQEALKAKSTAKGKGKDKKVPQKQVNTSPETKPEPEPEADQKPDVEPRAEPDVDPKPEPEAEKQPEKKPKPPKETPVEAPEEEAPPPEPTEAEKAGIKPPKRREVSAVERREALNVIVGSFPPETAAQLISANLHPDDIRTLVRKYHAAKSSVNVGNPSKFAEKVSSFYQTAPAKVPPPEEWGGKALKAMTPEERSEATQQYQIQQVALSLAAKEALTKTLSSPGRLMGKPQIPKDMAGKFATLMLSNVPPEHGSKMADQMFDETLKSGKVSKLGDGAVRRLMSQLNGNPTVQKVATAWLQANDYQAAKQKFLMSGDISEWDSPGSIVSGLKKANQYFSERSKLYGSDHEDHPASNMFRRRLLSRLQSLSPKRASEVQRLIPKLEMSEYETKKKAWGAKYQEWEKKRAAHEAALKAHKANPGKVKDPGEFTEPEPSKPQKPITSFDEDGKSMWDDALKTKTASDSTYSEHTMMGSKTSVYHGIAPVAVTYPGWSQPHQRDFGDTEAKKVLAEAKDWLSSPMLTAAMDGSVPDAKFRAALDYALLSTNQKVDPVQYNVLLAKLSGQPAPSVVEDPQGNLGEVKTATAAPAKPFKPSPGMKASKELRKFATRVADMKLAFEMLAFADHLADEEEKAQQHSEHKQASESKLVTLRSTLIRKASELDPSIQAAIKPILQAIKDLD